MITIFYAQSDTAPKYTKQKGAKNQKWIQQSHNYRGGFGMSFPECVCACVHICMYIQKYIHIHVSIDICIYVFYMNVSK